MSDVIDELIENHLVNDVTEKCTKNAHTIQNVVPVDEFNDITDDENPSLLRYIFQDFYNSSDTFKRFKMLQ